jgi:hypothetical protein
MVTDCPFPGATHLLVAEDQAIGRWVTQHRFERLGFLSAVERVSWAAKPFTIAPARTLCDATATRLEPML